MPCYILYLDGVQFRKHWKAQERSCRLFRFRELTIAVVESAIRRLQVQGCWVVKAGTDTVAAKILLQIGSTFCLNDVQMPYRLRIE